MSKNSMKTFTQFLYETNLNANNEDKGINSMFDYNPFREYKKMIKEEGEDVRRQLEMHLHDHMESVTGRRYDDLDEEGQRHRDGLIDNFAREAHKHFQENGDMKAAIEHGINLINGHLGR